MALQDGEAPARSVLREARLRVVLVMNLAVVIGQAVAGVAGHSLGLLADAGHNLADVVAVITSLVAVRAAAAGGVAVAGAVIVLTGGWRWLDPVVSLAIAVVIAWQAWRLLRATADVLLESTPVGLDPARLSAAIVAVEGVDAVHDLHAWSLSSEVRALSAHVVLSGHPTLEEAQIVGERVKRAVSVPFAIAHATLELECEPCQDAEPGCEIDAVVQQPNGRRHA